MHRPLLINSVVLGLLSAFLLPRVVKESNASWNGPNSYWTRVGSGQWQLIADPETGLTRCIYGGLQRPEQALDRDHSYADIAKSHLAEASPLFMLNDSTLRLDTVSILPLGLVGSTDKISVRLTQEVNSIPVHNGNINLIMTWNGDLLCIDSTGLPELDPSFSTTPGSSALMAQAFAATVFLSQMGMSPREASEPKLLIAQEMSAGRRRPTLVWDLDLWTPVAGSLPLGYRYLIAANGDPRVVERHQLIHSSDVGGTVQGKVCQEVFPDTSSTAKVLEPMPFLLVSSSEGTTTTDIQGHFNFPGVDGPLDLTFGLSGPYASIINMGGSNYTQMQSLSGSNNEVLFNVSPTQFDTAQMNAFTRVNHMREWILGINPLDSVMEVNHQVNVNILGVCSAYYNGRSINFSRRGGVLPNSCVNTSYSTVIYHEMGHWLNDRYGSGNGEDGFGEGNADVFSMYLTDSPIIGLEFSPGSYIRSGDNLRQFCGDSNPSCYGEVHDDGEPLMGVSWKVRANLKAELGDELGKSLANCLLNSWMLGFDQREIKRIIEAQWLVLDDDNGDLSDGTPHFAPIDRAFRTQGFPGLPNNAAHRKPRLPRELMDHR